MSDRVTLAYGFDGLILAENLMYAGIEFTLHETAGKRPIFLNPARDPAAMLLDFDDLVVFPIYSTGRREWMRSDTPLNDVILTVRDSRLYDPISVRIVNVRPFINEVDPSTVGLNSGKLAAHYGLMPADAEHDALHDITSLGLALSELRRRGHDLNLD